MPIRYFFASVFFAFLLACLPSDLTAQRPIGIRWVAPDDVERAGRELEIFRSMGISHLEVNRRLSSAVWSKITDLEFKIYGSLPVPFPLTHTFAEPDSMFLNMIRNLVTHYSNQKTVQAISLYQYGPSHDDRFTKTIMPYVQQIREIYSGKLYYLTKQSDFSLADGLFDFKMVSVNADSDLSLSPEDKEVIYYYNPSDELKPYLTPVKKFLEETSSVSAPVFFDSQWILQILKTHPELQQTIQLYASDSEPVFAMPEENISTTSSHSLIVMLLMFVWGAFAVNYSLSPVFRRSLFRYFIAHRFYVDDIMQRHIRSMAPAGVMLLLHAVLAGIAVYCFISVNFSDLGIEALSFYLPVSVLDGNFMLAVVVGTCLIILVIEIVCLFWLLLTNRRMRQLAQAVNLYAWPMQLNLFIVTGMVTLLMAGYDSVLISSLGGIALLVFLSSFVITSLDTTKYVKNKYLYLAGTSTLYSAIWIALLVWVLNYTYLTDVYKLALWLS